MDEADDRTPIYLFEVEDAYYFSYFFTRDDLFDELADYYNGDAYRFEVPTSEFDAVTTFLEDHWFEPVVVDDIAAFCVVKDRYTPHADILKQSVMHWHRRGYNFFVMRDPLAFEQAIEEGATPIEETDLVVGI